MKTKFSRLFFYRIRYLLGGLALVSLYLLAVAAAMLYAPGGVSSAETTMIAKTNELDLSRPESLAVANLPFHLLQMLSFQLFGVSILSIKLPAAILSIISVISIFCLLRRWFKLNVTILTMLLMVATGQFIFIGQSFTPHILYVTYLSVILLLTSLVLQRARLGWLWRILLAVTVALSLLTPYFWYFNLGMLLVALFHPHTRHYLLSRKYRGGWLAAFVIFCLLIVGLAVLCLLSPKLALAKDLLGYENLSFEIVANLKTLFYTYISPTVTISHGQILPLLDFGALMLIILGFFKSFIQRHTARTYMIWAWLLLAMSLLMLNPSLTTIVTVPLFILLAVGVETLLSEWYGLFPKNPYARGVGLLMLIGLIGVMTLSGIDRYINGYRHMPEAVSEFSDDLSIFNRAPKHETYLLVAAKDERPIYAALAKVSRGRLRVVERTAGKGQIFVTKKMNANVKDDPRLQLSSVLVSSRTTDSDRFYVYKTTEE